MSDLVHSPLDGSAARSEQRVPEGGAPAREEMGRDVALLALIACILQLAPLAAGLVGERRSTLADDALEYWRLSEAGWFSFYRPPGYPLFLALVRSFSDSTLAVAWTQSLLAALVPSVVYGVARKTFASSRAAAAIGALACAASFTSLALSKRIYADSLVTILCAGAFAILVISSRRCLWGPVAAGAFAALALLTKPIYVLWLPLAPVILALLGARRRHLVQRSLAALVLPLTVWIGISSAQYLRHGQFVYSGIGRLAVIRYWAASTAVLARHDGAWTAALWVEESVKPVEAFEEATAPAVSKQLAREALETLQEHPFRAVQALLLHAWMNLHRPFHRGQLDFLSQRARNGLPQLLPGLSVLLALLAALGFATSLIDPAMRASGVALGAVWLTFVGATSISTNEGARLMAPVEWVLFVFAAVGWNQLAEASRGWRAAPRANARPRAVG